MDTNEKLLQDKTPEIIEKLIRMNSRLVWKQISKFGLLDDPEAESLGFEALYKAILTFDVHKKSKFSTYATVCIYNSLGSYVRKLNTMIVKNTISYDEPIDDKGATHLTNMESSASADRDMLERDSLEFIFRSIEECINEVTNKTQLKILELWHGSCFSLTNKEIASKAGCSQSYVNQTLNRFRKNLKNKLEVRL